MGSKKLTKAEKLVAEQMMAILEWASESPDRWHSIGALESTKEAARLLEARGVIQTNQIMNLYRLKPPPR